MQVTGPGPMPLPYRAEFEGCVQLAVGWWSPHCPEPKVCTVSCAHDCVAVILQPQQQPAAAAMLEGAIKPVAGWHLRPDCWYHSEHQILHPRYYELLLRLLRL